MNFKLVLFDLMDTLLVDPFFPVIHRMCRSDEEIKHWSADRSPGMFEAFESGKISEAGYFRQFYRHNDHNWWRPEKIKKYMFRQIRFVEGMKELFEDVLKSGEVQTGIASNYSGWYSEVLRLRPEIEMADYLFFSCELGVRKPDSEFYRMIQDSVGIAPDQIIFIDDRLKNTKAAEKEGWGTFLFDGSSGSVKKIRQLFVQAGILQPA